VADDVADDVVPIGLCVGEGEGDVAVDGAGEVSGERLAGGLEEDEEELLTESPLSTGTSGRLNALLASRLSLSSSWAVSLSPRVATSSLRPWPPPRKGKRCNSA